MDSLTLDQRIIATEARVSRLVVNKLKQDRLLPRFLSLVGTYAGGAAGFATGASTSNLLNSIATNDFVEVASAAILLTHTVSGVAMGMYLGHKFGVEAQQYLARQVQRAYSQIPQYQNQ